MKATLRGGPYDGIVLDHNDVNLYTIFHAVGFRKFIFMPPLADWDAVRHGDKGKFGPFDSPCFTYELVHIGHAILEGRYDSDGTILGEATREYQEGRQP